MFNNKSGIKPKLRMKTPFPSFSETVFVCNLFCTDCLKVAFKHVNVTLRLIWFSTSTHSFHYVRKKNRVAVVLTHCETLQKSIEAPLYYYLFCNIRINDNTGKRFFLCLPLKIFFKNEKIFNNFLVT